LFKKAVLFLILMVLILSACSNFKNIVGGCPDAEISWIDALMINDIQYEGGDKGLSEGEIPDKGEKIGEVNFTLADNACSDHKLKNGDSAFLPIGTEIYEIKGYRPDFRVLAGDKVYQVSEYKKAEIISELLDIKGKVAKMSIESDYDESHIADFTEQGTTAFIEDLLSLEYAGPDKVHKKIKGDNRVFLRIHLKDGSSFNFVYWPVENILGLGAFGTEEMKEIVKMNQGN
jgi:hypothetical protein